MIDFKIDAHMPEYYITGSAMRMGIYKKISLIRSPADKDEVLDEITDRFGDPPKPTERLLLVAMCRAIAERAGIPRIELRGQQILFYTDKPDLSIWSMILPKHHGQLMGTAGKAPIVYRLKAGEEAIRALACVLEDYFEEMKN